MCQHGVRADGAHGQYAIAIPEKDIAIATTAGVANMQQVLTLIWDILLPDVTGDTLPEDPVAHKELLEQLDALSIPLAAGDLTPRHAPAAWKFQPNSAGATDARAVFPRRRISAAPPQAPPGFRIPFLKLHSAVTKVRSAKFSALTSPPRKNRSLRPHVSAVSAPRSSPN